MHADAGLARQRGGGFERLLRRGDQVDLVTCEHRIARLRRLEGAALQPGAGGCGDGDAIAREDAQRISASG